MIKFKPADFLALTVSIAAAAITGFFVYSGYTPPAALEINLSGSKLIYQLDSDRTVNAKGPLGNSVIVIQDNHAYFESSPCPDKLCVKHGKISQTGEWTGCLPNRIFINITGGEIISNDQKVDALSY